MDFKIGESVATETPYRIEPRTLVEARSELLALPIEVPAKHLHSRCEH